MITSRMGTRSNPFPTLKNKNKPITKQEGRTTTTNTTKDEDEEEEVVVVFVVVVAYFVV